MKKVLLIVLILFSFNFTNVSYSRAFSEKSSRSIAYVINTESDKNTLEIINKKREFIVVNYLILLSSIKAVDFVNKFYNSS
jgi:hypothetical protein